MGSADIAMYCSVQQAACGRRRAARSASPLAPDRSAIACSKARGPVALLPSNGIARWCAWGAQATERLVGVEERAGRQRSECRRDAQWIVRVGVPGGGGPAGRVTPCVDRDKGRTVGQGTAVAAKYGSGPHAGQAGVHCGRSAVPGGLQAVYLLGGRAARCGARRPLRSDSRESAL
jgi:hypothetical protein